jgi:hypothetical protein
VSISCKFKHCQGNGKIELDDGQLAWYKKKGIPLPETCNPCKRWKDSVSSQSVGCSKCGRNPRTYESKQIIGANMLGDKSWNQVRSSYVCTDCYHAEKKRLEPKVNIKCSFEHCLSPRGFFEMGQGEIDFLRGKGLTTPTSCKPCREWKKSVADQRIQCGTCRTNVDIAAKTIIYQQQNGDVNWQQFQRNFTCKLCKANEGAIKLTCANNFCHQERLTRSKEFLLTKKDQDYFKSEGKPNPTRCKPCRDYKNSLKKIVHKCGICNRSTNIEPFDIIKHMNKMGQPWENCKDKYECEGCLGFGKSPWFPSDRGWGTVKDGSGLLYRWKEEKGKITEQMFSNPCFNDEQAHAQHIHIFDLQESVGYGSTFSFEEDSNPPSLAFFDYLAELGIKSNHFALINGKYRLFLTYDLWRLYRSGEPYNVKNRSDIGFDLASKIMQFWRK